MKTKDKLAIAGLGIILSAAFGLAGIAAYMSIVGLAELFAAHAIIIIIAGMTIEWAKIITVGALHMFWKKLPFWKYMIAGFILVHMAITNIGVYGYLSSGYLEQKQPETQIQLEIDRIEDRIEHQQQEMDRVLPQLDALDEAERRYIENLYIQRSQQYREDNAERRTNLEQRLSNARQRIVELNEQKADLLEKREEVGAKLGSIKHISGYVSDDALKAVTYFTILLMLGLDPMAVMLMMFFSYVLAHYTGFNRERFIEAVAEKAPVVAKKATDSQESHYSKGKGNVTKPYRERKQ